MFEKGSSTRRNFLAGSPSVLMLGAVPAAAMKSADAELIGLGHEFKAAWVIEQAAWAAWELDTDDQFPPGIDEPCASLARRIDALSATTAQGLMVKAMAVNWCHAADFKGFSETTDERIAAGIIRDLLALAA